MHGDSEQRWGLTAEILDGSWIGSAVHQLNHASVGLCMRIHGARKSADGSILHLAIGQWYRSAGRARARVKYAYSGCQSDQIMHVQK